MIMPVLAADPSQPAFQKPYKHHASAEREQCEHKRHVEQEIAMIAFGEKHHHQDHENRCGLETDEAVRCVLRETNDAAGDYSEGQQKRREQPAVHFAPSLLVTSGISSFWIWCISIEPSSSSIPMTMEFGPIVVSASASARRAAELAIGPPASNGIERNKLAGFFWKINRRNKTQKMIAVPLMTYPGSRQNSSSQRARGWNFAKRLRRIAVKPVAASAAATIPARISPSSTFQTKANHNTII